MGEEIKKMDQAVAKTSTFIKRMKDQDSQQAALNKAISDFWDTMDVPQESSPVKIASYPSLESLNEEPMEELTEAEYDYYTKKRIILVEKWPWQMRSIWLIYRTMNKRTLRIGVKNICFNSMNWVTGSINNLI